MSDLLLSGDANVRSNAYYVARRHAVCWHCGLAVCLLALAVPQGHETLDTDSDIELGRRQPVARWQRANCAAFLFYVVYLADTVQAQLRLLSSCFRPAYCDAVSITYWANHCENCGALLDDHELHGEPGGAFMPSHEGEAAEIQLLQIEQPFTATSAGYALEPEFFQLMSKV